MWFLLLLEKRMNLFSVFSSLNNKVFKDPSNEAGFFMPEIYKFKIHKELFNDTYS